MCSLNSFLLLLSMLTATSTKKLPYETPSKCVSLFAIDEPLFEICKTEKCFLFRTEKPYVFVSKSFNSTASEAPFRCRDRRTLHPGLHGAFFKILDEIPELDAYCVWGGADCVFDDMVWFVGNASKAKKPHKFAVGGLMFMLRYRITEHTIPGAPLLDDRLIVVGPRLNREGASEAFRTIWRPFSDDAWTLLFGVAAFLLLGRLVNALRMTMPFTRSNFSANLFGAYESVTPHINGGVPLKCEECTRAVDPDPDCASCKHRNAEQEKRDARILELRALNSNWATAARLFSLIALLFYEIAVVNFIFEGRASTLISELRPNRFAMLKDSTQEHVIRRIMKARGVLVEGITPWVRSLNLDSMYRSILESDPPLYTMSYETLNQYMFWAQQNACMALKIYEPYKPLPSFAGVWYYGGMINLTDRTYIDRQIAALRESGHIREILSEYMGSTVPERCGSRHNIGVLMIAFPLVIFMGPFILYQLYVEGKTAFNAIKEYCVRPRDE